MVFIPFRNKEIQINLVFFDLLVEIFMTLAHHFPHTHFTHAISYYRLLFFIVYENIINLETEKIERESNIRSALTIALSS